MNPVDEAIRDFAVKALNEEAEEFLKHDKIDWDDGDNDLPMLGVKIYDYDLWRVWRDDKKNIFKIELRKGDKVKGFVLTDG